MRFPAFILTTGLLLFAPLIQAADSPNILIIYADQFRHDCFGAAGNPDIKTPNIDALARDGVRYTNSFCTWPVCTPSRLSFLTGQYVQQHGGRSNRSTLTPGTPTFASILKEAGYKTEAIGKMHFTPAYQDVGFEKMLLAEQNGPGRNVDDYHRYLKERGLINARDLMDQERLFRLQAPRAYWETFGAQVSDLPEEHHITTWVADRAVESLLEWQAGEANLLMIGFVKPHHPFDPPAPWHKMYDPETITVLPGWTDRVSKGDFERGRGYFNNKLLTKKALRRVAAYYYGAISHLDHHIGRLIAVLQKQGLYDNTLIIFTADHGEYLGFHHLLLKGNHMYDPLIKVPLVIKHPKQFYAGAVTDELVNALDVTATILKAAAQNPPRHLRGVPLGVDTPGRLPQRSVVIAQHGGDVMARTKRYKLILARSRSDSMLFDLEKDPYETKNLVDDWRYVGTKRSLQEAILRWFRVEAIPTPYVQGEVQLIQGRNVPQDMKATENEMKAYFKAKVEDYLKNAEPPP